MAYRKQSAIAYLRTSSAANVNGSQRHKTATLDKDSEHRQRDAIAVFAKRSGYELVAEFYDAAVSGADPIQDRPGFAALLDRIEGNGVRTVIVEDASRFARELMAQELGITLLIQREVRLLTAGGDDLTASDDPSRKMMRQIAGAFAEYEKARLVAKLRAARERKRQTRGKCEGRRTRIERAQLRGDTGEAQRLEAAIAMAKRLHRASPKTGKRMSLRKISDELAAAGHLNERGKPFNPWSIQNMLSGPQRQIRKPTSGAVR
jgi:DNA invertase Pin-like site-specific DNA recombinase